MMSDMVACYKLIAQSDMWRHKPTDAEAMAWMDRSNLFNYVYNKAAGIPQPARNDMEEYLLLSRLTRKELSK